MSAHCPDRPALAGYLTGRLEESAAQDLVVHVEACPACQRKLDQLDTASADSLALALRRSTDDPPDSPELARLIARAQSIDGQGINTSPDAADIVRGVDLEAMLCDLRASGVVEPSALDSLLHRAELPGSHALVRALVEQDLLTGFQARAFLRGRGRALVLGDYVILDKLGQGGMGHVFKAYHRRLDRIVGLKVLHAPDRQSPEMLERFAREARAVAALSHPNIVVAHDAGEVRGVHFLAMEFIHGADLARLVSEEGPLPLPLALKIVHELADALGHAHDHGIVHRDVKPHNVLVAGSGAVKLVDLGLARFESFLASSPDAPAAASMTTTTTIMGSVDYMAPEQALNGRHADARSDVYGLGCTLFHILTGDVLYRGDTVIERLIAHREHAIPKLASRGRRVTKGVQAVFARAVAKTPAHRYQSMRELADDIAALQGGRVPSALLQAPRSPARRSAVIALVLALAVGAAAAFTAGRTADPEAGTGSRPTTVSTTVSTTGVQSADVGTVARPASPEVQALPPRILVVIPYRDFSSSDYASVTRALSERQVEYSVASTELGVALPRHRKHGKTEPVEIDLRLDAARREDFTALILCGGVMSELTGIAASASMVRDTIRDWLRDGKLVAGTSEGRDVLAAAGVLETPGVEKYSGLSAGASDKPSGGVVTIPDPELATSLVDVLVGDSPSP